MSKNKTNDEVKTHVKESINKLQNHLIDTINNDVVRGKSCADKISYWINDYTNYLRREKKFDPTRLIKYKKGDIVKINLGYRLGSEEGGLHFGVVLDVNNSKRSGVITIVPLTSQRPGRNIHPDSVPIGKEIFASIISKHDTLKRKLDAEKEELNRLFSLDDSLDENEVKRLSQLLEKLDELSLLKKSILKMKEGSVALVNQIMTVSKMRIYDPTYSHDVLYGIRLSHTTIRDIDEKIMDMFIYRE